VKYFPVHKGILGRVVGYVRAVDEVTFSLNEGETFALVEKSGSGKTTVARCILGLLRLTSGEIKFMGKDVFKLKRRELKWFRRNIQAVFQNPFLSLNPRMKVEDIVAKPLRVRKRELSKSDVRDRVQQVPEKVSLSTLLAKHYSYDLSGGQAQRVAIARTIISNPKLMKVKRRITLPREPPSVINPPNGCKLSSRCLYATSKCGEEELPLIKGR